MGGGPLGKKIYFKAQVWIYRKTPGGLEVLLLKTISKRGGFWQPVTGKVEKGESLEQGALREAREETGLFFGASKLLDLSYNFEFEGKWGSAREWAFALEVPRETDEVTLDPKEHDNYEWVSVSKDQAKSRLSFASNEAGLDALVRCLGEFHHTASDSPGKKGY